MEKNNNNPADNENNNINNPRRLFNQRDNEQTLQESNTYTPPQIEDKDTFNQNQQQYQSNGYSNHNFNSSNSNNTNVNNKLHNNYHPPIEEPNNNGAIWKIIGCLGVSLLALVLCGFLIYQAVSGMLNYSNVKNVEDNKTEQTNDNNINENNNDDNNTNNDNNNMTVNENDENEKELYNNENENNNANGDIVTFDEGFYTVGKDIEPGRYLIGSKNRGNLFITEGNRAYFVNEIVGTGDEDVIAQIEDGQKIEIKTANDVVFKPIDDKMYQDELFAGVYIVGKHIEPGEYKFTAINEGFTSISTFKEENGAYNSKNYYSLNIKDEKETDVTLNEDEILNIQNAVKVKIEKK